MLSEQQKRDFCAIMLQKYGVPIDVNNELLPVFFVAYKSAVMSENTSKFTSDKLLKGIAEFEKNTVEKLSKMETKQFRFQNAKEAFWFAFGKYGLSVVTVSLFLFSYWLIDRLQETSKQPTGYVADFLQKASIRQMKVDSKNLAHVMLLYPVKNVNQAEAGKNYIYHKECDCIEVPVYFETNQ